MSILSITYADIKAKLNPNDSGNSFGIPERQVPEEIVQEIIDEQKDFVFSRIPTKYQPLLTNVPGEILIDANRTQAGARGGETELQLAASRASFAFPHLLPPSARLLPRPISVAAPTDALAVPAPDVPFAYPPPAVSFLLLTLFLDELLSQHREYLFHYRDTKYVCDRGCTAC